MNPKIRAREGFFLLLCVIVLATLPGCGSASFSNGSSQVAKSEDAQINPRLEDPKEEPKPDKPVTEAFTGESSEVLGNAVDVVIGVDTSGSMSEEAAAISENLSSFLQNFLSNNVDARLTLIAARDPFVSAGSSAPEVKVPEGLPVDRFTHYQQYIDSVNAIGIINSYFANSQKDLELRTDAILEVIVISDDNGWGEGNLAKDFQKPEAKAVHFNGIIGTSSSTCSIAKPGDEYETLAAETGGSIFDLCSPDWKKLTDDLSDKIISRAGDSFKLRNLPDTARDITVTVNGRVLQNGEFKIDEQNQTLILNIEVQNGDDIVVTYWVKA